MADQPQMLLTTTNTLDGIHVQRYLGVVSGEAILGANVFRDFFAGSVISWEDAPPRMRRSCAAPRRSPWRR